MPLVLTWTNNKSQTMCILEPKKNQGMTCFSKLCLHRLWNCKVLTYKGKKILEGVGAKVQNKIRSAGPFNLLQICLFLLYIYTRIGFCIFKNVSLDKLLNLFFFSRVTYLFIVLRPPFPTIVGPQITFLYHTW